MTQDARADPLAQAIAEGVQVDWDSAKSAAPDDDARALISELAVIAAIGQVHSSAAPRHDAVASTVHVETPTWGPFRLLERIGQGAYGEVYRALDTRLDREVALKLLPEAMTTWAGPGTSTIREGSLLARVRHPNVVTIHGAEQIGDRIGLWMEFVRGRTLEQILDERTTLADPEVVEIGIQVCRALAAVHAAGLIHRDIKAQNVMRATDGRIVVMDFGAGRMATSGSSSDLAGTPLYLAPEVLRGEPATVQSDVYAAGVLLYRLVTGSFPVGGRTVGEVRQGHERRDRAPVRHARPDISPRLARLIERAIEPDPRKRFESADGLAAALESTSLVNGGRRLAWTATLLAAFAAGIVGWQVVGDQRPGVAPPADEWQARARALLGRRGIPSVQQAAELYAEALAGNPDSAVAHAGLAHAHALMTFPDRGTPFEDAYPVMRRSAAAALQLDRRLADSQAAQGWVYAYERNWSAAEHAFREAIRLNPADILNYTNYSLAVLQPLRKFDEALRLLAIASRHDPRSLDVQREIGEVLLYAGRFADAVETLQRVRTADPDLAFTQTYLARALIFAGRVDEALALWQPMAIWPAQAYVRVGRRKEAEALAAEHAAYPHRAALLSAALGDTPGVVEAVERAAMSAPHRMGRLLIEPELAPFRDHPRIVALRQAFKLP